MQDGVARFTVSIPPELLSTFDAVSATKGYASRSEALRDAMRDYLLAHEWPDGSEEVVSTLTLLRDAGDAAPGQMEGASTVSSLCVPAGDSAILEVRVLRGRRDAVGALADSILSGPGVRFGRMVSLNAHVRV